MSLALRHQPFGNFFFTRAFLDLYRHLSVLSRDFPASSPSPPQLDPDGLCFWLIGRRYDSPSFALTAIPHVVVISSPRVLHLFSPIL